MDSTRLEQLITENMKTVFGFAISRLGNAAEAEELASDILYSLVKASPSLRDEARFYPFMWRIAENTYVDYLRRKSKSAKWSVPLDENISDESDMPLTQIIRCEELQKLRRELSLLSKQYREATVLYYIENLSCAQTAKKLGISTEMVKYYLFRARKILREGMSMERTYGEKSYRPEEFEIDFWGTHGGVDREYWEFHTRRIKGNILLAAYYTPVTAQELALELGVALPYLEDELELLVGRGYLTLKNGRYLTNIPIITREATEAIERRLGEYVPDAAARFAGVTGDFAARFGDRFENENLMRHQKVMLSLVFSLDGDEEDAIESINTLPSDGPYSIVHGGEGRGIVWGKKERWNFEPLDKPSRNIRGIYTDCPSSDGRGSVVAVNFGQTVNVQKFSSDMTDPLVATACGGLEALPDEWKKSLSDGGYARNGGANFPIWTAREYGELRTLLGQCTAIVSELGRRGREISAAVIQDIAPEHVRESAAYVGSLTKRFCAVEAIVNALFDMGYLKDVDSDGPKPALCVIKN